MSFSVAAYLMSVRTIYVCALKSMFGARERRIALG